MILACLSEFKSSLKILDLLHEVPYFLRDTHVFENENLLGKEDWPRNDEFTKQTMKLLAESTFAGLFWDRPIEKYEASDVTIVEGEAYVIFDSNKLLNSTVSGCKLNASDASMQKKSKKIFLDFLWFLAPKKR